MKDNSIQMHDIDCGIVVFDSVYLKEEKENLKSQYIKLSERSIKIVLKKGFTEQEFLNLIEDLKKHEDNIYSTTCFWLKDGKRWIDTDCYDINYFLTLREIPEMPIEIQ